MGLRCTGTINRLTSLRTFSQSRHADFLVHVCVLHAYFGSLVHVGSTKSQVIGIREKQWRSQSF